MIRCSHQFDQFHRCCNEAVTTIMERGEPKEALCALHVAQKQHLDRSNHIVEIRNRRAVSHNLSDSINSEINNQIQLHTTIASMANLIAELQSKVEDLEEQVEGLQSWQNHFRESGAP